VYVPLQCKACPDTQASSGFDPDSGARRCGDAFSPFVLELALASHTGCDEGLPMYQQVECDVHTVLVRRRPQDRLRCVGCETLLGADGFARGSHLPFMTDACQTCVDNFRMYNSLEGVSAACGFCDNCSNCLSASTFDAMARTSAGRWTTWRCWRWPRGGRTPRGRAVAAWGAGTS